MLYRGSGRMIKLDEWTFTEWLTPYSGRLFCIFMVFFSYTGHCAIKWLYDAVYDIVATLFLLPQKFCHCGGCSYCMHTKAPMYAGCVLVPFKGTLLVF